MPRRKRPGSIHEGGELGYSLSHAFGAAFDNPDLLVACVVGDGEAETGPLATCLAWQQIPEPGQRRRGAADPAPERLQDRQPDDPGAHPARRSARAAAGLRLGRRSSSRATTPPRCTRRWRRRSMRRSAASAPSSRKPAAAAAGAAHDAAMARWPMIVLRSPKGWTCPKEVDGLKLEDYWRVPSGADPGHQHARPPGRAGSLDALLSAGRAVRRGRQADRSDPRAWRPRASGA